ncbi:MAG: hypothetical protein LAQ69_11335 [Acidobacteriia bacterium]|nr:hypothetical protein [Terriglobia bacterium]
MLRTESPRSGVSAVRTLLSCGFLLLLVLGAYWAARLAWADHLSRSDKLADRLRAVELSPDATFYERLADKREELGGVPLPDLQRAVARDPANAVRLQRLGAGAELAGNFELAEASFLQAAALSRQYQPRYSLAQYYFRRQNADGFWRWSRAAFESAYGDITPLLDLGWRMRPDAEWLSQQALSQRPEVARQQLVFLVRHGQWRGTRKLALDLSKTAQAGDLPALMEYCDQSLSEGAAQTAIEVWDTVCHRGLLPYRPLEPAAGISLTNSGFEHPPLGMGFDWRFVQPSWLRSVQSNGGMRLTFSGDQPESCLIAWQYVPVVPGAHYRLHFDVRAIDMPSADGLDWMVYGAPGKAVAIERSADHWLSFSPPSEVIRLSLMYQRPVGSPRLSGTIAIAGVQLRMAR